MIEMILATDNAHHFKLIARLRRRLARAVRPLPVPDGTDSSGTAPATIHEVDEEDDSGAEDDDVEDEDAPGGGGAGAAAAGDPQPPPITRPLDPRKPNDAKLMLQVNHL